MSKAQGKPDNLSRGWLWRFFQRKRLTRRRRTTVAQKSPSDVLTKLVEFVKFIREQRKKHGYADKDVIGADETAVWLDMPGKTFLLNNSAIFYN